MWRFNVGDISEHQFRLLRFLVQHGGAEAHIVVKSDKPWPREIYVSRYQRDAKVPRDAIN